MNDKPGSSEALQSHPAGGGGSEQSSIKPPVAHGVEDKGTTLRSQETVIVREIGIDMGHRVTNHGSKCRNMHGHRYKIEAAVAGGLYTSGEQEGMVLDFGFLKEEMMKAIDAIFDHGMCLWRRDEIVIATLTTDELNAVDEAIKLVGIGYLAKSKFWGKIVVVPQVPTAENLSRLWYELMREPVKRRSDGKAKLLYIKVWETPNSQATYLP